MAIRIAQKDKQLLLLIREGLKRAGIDEEKAHVRFDGKVHRLVMTCRSTVITAMIKYLDRYPFLSTKNLQYQYFRKAYLLKENREHLTHEGLQKLYEYKTKMSKLYRDPQRLHALPLENPLPRREAGQGGINSEEK